MTGIYTCLHLIFFHRHLIAKKKRDLPNSELREQTNEIFQQAIKKSTIVHFFAVQKRMSNNRYKIIFECEESKKKDSSGSERIMSWKKEGYTAMDPEYTGDFLSSENQMYHVKLSGNNLMKEFGTMTLRFISKRINYQELTIKPGNTNLRNIMHGALDVYDMLMDRKVTSIPFWLTADIPIQGI